MRWEAAVCSPGLSEVPSAQLPGEIHSRRAGYEHCGLTKHVGDNETELVPAPPKRFALPSLSAQHRQNPINDAEGGIGAA